MTCHWTPAAALLLAVATTVPVNAQRPWGPLERPGLVDSVGPIDVSTIPMDVAAAEAEGRNWPRIEAVSSQQHPEYISDEARLAGPRTCGTGVGMGPVRSGEFVIGGTLQGQVKRGVGQMRKVWYQPVHPALEYDLVVRGRSLSNPADTMRMVFTEWVHSPGREVWFFPSGTIIPAVGSWMLLVTHGPNWGCFLIESVSLDR